MSSSPPEGWGFIPLSLVQSVSRKWVQVASEELESIYLQWLCRDLPQSLNCLETG